MAAPAAPNIATAWCRAQLAASACSYRQDPAAWGTTGPGTTSTSARKEQPQHLPVQRLASPASQARFALLRANSQALSLLGCSSAAFGTNTPEYCFYPGRVRSRRRIWLPREARRRVIRLALSRPVAIPLGGRHRGHGPAAPSLRRLAGIRDRRHAGGGGGPVARPAGVAAVWASADRRGLGFPRCRPDGGSLCARLESAGRAAGERRGWAGR